MSPEMVGDRGHGLSTDLWSFGATVYVLLYGDFPYVPEKACPKAMKRAILKGEPAPCYERHSSGESMKLSSELAEAFVRALLERAVKERPSVEQALELAFLRREIASPVAPVTLLEGDTITSGAWTGTVGGVVRLASGKALAFGQVLSSRARRSRPDEELQLANMAIEASKKTLQYEPSVNRIVQRSLDEVLERLQMQVLHFSEPPMDSSTVDVYGVDDDVGSPVQRVKSKRSTHSGVIRTSQIVVSLRL